MNTEKIMYSAGDPTKGAHYWIRLVIQEYTEYVANDPHLEPDSKRIRRQTAVALERYVLDGLNS